MLKSFWSYMLSAVEESLAILLLLIIGDALPRPTSRWARARHDKSALRQKAPQQSQAFLPCSSARELRQDTDESAYYEIDKNRPLSFQEIKSDLVLSNGARFYNDHAHPEYSTPECTTVRELVTQDKAGERILAECARRRDSHLPQGRRVRLYKNNTDFLGHSYGCHDNYLMRRDVPWER